MRVKLASNSFAYVFGAMASHFSTLLAMCASARSPINPLRRPPLITGHHPPLPARRRYCCRCCMPHARALPALPCYCAYDCTLNQPLPLPTANLAACLTHSTICTTAAPPRVARAPMLRCCCMPHARALPALPCYCAPTALSPSLCLSQRLTQPQVEHTRLSVRLRLHHRSLAAAAAAAAACLMHAHYLPCPATVHPTALSISLCLSQRLTQPHLFSLLKSPPDTPATHPRAPPHGRFLAPLPPPGHWQYCHTNYAPHTCGATAEQASSQHWGAVHHQHAVDKRGGCGRSHAPNQANHSLSRCSSRTSGHFQHRRRPFIHKCRCLVSWRPKSPTSATHSGQSPR
jgi:hypothetical protein